MIEGLKYSPILKTTDAELKGFDKLHEDVKNAVLPIFELTRSRKTPKNPERTIEKRMDDIKEVFGSSRPFILDVTAHEDLMNEEIEDLGNELHGFANWCEFVATYKTKNLLNIIPVIHMLPPELEAEELIHQQITRLSENFELLAFRFSPFDYSNDTMSQPSDEELEEELTYYLDTIAAVLDFQKLVLILDAQFIDQSNLARKIATFKKLLSVVGDYGMLKKTIILSSSFPLYVVGHEDDCEDDQGTISILEKPFFKALCNDVLIDITYGDYGSIHPYRIRAGGGNWVPRIDYPLDHHIIYKRFRRDDGGYEMCASEMIYDPDFEFNQIECWGLLQIYNAANDEPVGKSPAFWISVRINLFISNLILEKQLPICKLKQS